MLVTSSAAGGSILSSGGGLPGGGPTVSAENSSANSRRRRLTERRHRRRSRATCTEDEAGGARRGSEMNASCASGVVCQVITHSIASFHGPSSGFESFKPEPEDRDVRAAPGAQGAHGCARHSWVIPHWQRACRVVSKRPTFSQPSRPSLTTARAASCGTLYTLKLHLRLLQPCHNLIQQAADAARPGRCA